MCIYIYILISFCKFENYNCVCIPVWSWRTSLWSQFCPPMRGLEAILQFAMDPLSHPAQLSVSISELCTFLLTPHRNLPSPFLSHLLSVLHGILGLQDYRNKEGAVPWGKGPCPCHRMALMTRLNDGLECPWLERGISWQLAWNSKRKNMLDNTGFVEAVFCDFTCFEAM